MVEDAVLCGLEPGAPEAVFGEEAVHAIDEIGTFAALATHPHEVIPPTKSRGVVQEFAYPTAREVHRIRARLARCEHPAVSGIPEIEAVKTQMTAGTIHEAIASAGFAIDVIQVLPDSSSVHSAKRLKIFL